MEQYFPVENVSAEKFSEINRRITRQEFADAIAAAQKVGLYRYG